MILITFNIQAQEKSKSLVIQVTAIDRTVMLHVVVIDHARIGVFEVHGCLLHTLK